MLVWEDLSFLFFIFYCLQKSKKWLRFCCLELLNGYYSHFISKVEKQFARDADVISFECIFHKKKL